MTHKQERLHFDKGTLVFDFDIEEDAIGSKIINIVVRGDFNSGIPEYPYLENMGDGWKLYAYDTIVENGKPVPTYNPITTIYARKMASVMREMQEKEMAMFVGLGL